MLDHLDEPLQTIGSVGEQVDGEHTTLIAAALNRGQWPRLTTGREEG